MNHTFSIETVMSQAATAAGLEVGQARLALTGALGLLDRHADAEVRDAVYAAVTGSQDLARSPEARPRGGGLMGGLMKTAGGLSGAAIADAMGLVDRLKKAGIDKAELKRLLSAAREQVRIETGHDLLGDAVRSVPGVGPLLGDG